MQAPLGYQEIWSTYKRGLPWVLVLASIYFLVVPLLWPRPTATVQMPTTTSLGEDIVIEVSASAWHSNFDITRVRFMPDPLRSSALVEQVPFYPIDVRDMPARNGWRPSSVNRFTWPHTRRYTLTVPLAQRAQEGALQAGTLTGTIFITAEAPRLGKFDRDSRGGHRSGNSPQAFPFTLEISAASQ